MERVVAEMAALRKRAEDAEAALAAAEDAKKTEAEKLAARAAKAEQLEPQVKALSGALTREVERQKDQLPEAMRDLMPPGTPDQQLDWIAKAREAATKLAPKGQPGQQNLPESGGRNPAGSLAGAQHSQLREAARQSLPALAGRLFPGVSSNGGGG